MNTPNKTSYELVADYLKSHPGIFGRYEEMFILGYAKSLEESKDYSREGVREVYDELGIIPDDENIYIGFIKLIEETFGLEDKNIIEVGGGVLPKLAERISTRIKNGTITVYDPRLSKYKEGTEKLKLVDRTFTRQTKIEDVDLIIGLQPCKGAEVIVEVATRESKDFIVALCEGGPHGDEFDYFETDEEWLDYIMNTAERKVKENNMGKLKIKDLKKYGNPYPVIYNDRENKTK